MKKLLFGAIVFILVITLLSGCGKKEPYVYKGVELLKNGDLEEEDPGTNFPKGWDKGGQAGLDENKKWIKASDEQLAQIKYIVDEEAGNNYIKIKTDITADENNFIYAYQAYEDNMPSGKQLKLTARVKTEGLTGEGAAIAISCIGAGTDGAASQFATTQGKIQITGTQDWTTYTVELTERVRSDIKIIVVYLLYLPETTGTVYFDDVSLIY